MARYTGLLRFRILAEGYAVRVGLGAVCQGGSRDVLVRPHRFRSSRSADVGPEEERAQMTPGPLRCHFVSSYPGLEEVFVVSVISSSRGSSMESHSGALRRHSYLGCGLDVLAVDN